MTIIKTFNFCKQNIPHIEEELGVYSKNWPVVYIINDQKEAYIGETTKVNFRMKSHLKTRSNLDKIHIIKDLKFNKSATLDIESHLIKYMSTDGKFELQNSNSGMISHNFYMRKEYRKLFREDIWPKLKSKGLVKKDLQIIENDDMFKYSPYTALIGEQYEVINLILDELHNQIEKGKSASIIVNGEAGTGKTVLGVYLMKLFNLTDENMDFEKDNIVKYIGELQKDIGKIGLVIPQQSLRKTLKKVFKNVGGLKAKMVISPNDSIKQNYDLLIVDETHRLRRRKNLTNYRSFDKNNEKLGLGKEGTELDWILNSSKHQIFFYDKKQSVKPTDIPHFKILNRINNTGNKLYKHKLHSQFRVSAKEDYLEYVEDLLNCNLHNKKKFKNYDFRLFEDIRNLKKLISKKEKEVALSRIVAGYGWKWKTKNNKASHDIKIDNMKFKWNVKQKDWVNSTEGKTDEIGCIHTIQGYDLNYVGVIFGPEIGYDEEKDKIIIRKDNYYDVKGKSGIKDPKKLKEYIKNIYSVLMTRGIKGTYVYVCDDKLRNYMKKFIETNQSQSLSQEYLDNFYPAKAVADKKQKDKYKKQH